MKIPPSERWKQLKEKFLQEIEAIDCATPWSETIPEWWTEMDYVKHYILTDLKEEMEFAEICRAMSVDREALKKLVIAANKVNV